MGIELIIGIIGALSISGYFVRRENKKKRIHGMSLEKMIIFNSILPMRKLLSKFNKILIEKVFANEEIDFSEINKHWKKIKEHSKDLSTFLTASGNGLDLQNQIILGKILTKFEENEDSQDIKQWAPKIFWLTTKFNTYLKLNKDIVTEMHNYTLQRVKENIKELNKDKKYENYDKMMNHLKLGLKQEEEDYADIMND